MKYRNGFVSNSSSSSFICRGFIIDGKTLQKMLCKDEEMDLLEIIENKIYEDGITIEPMIEDDYDGKILVCSEIMSSYNNDCSEIDLNDIPTADKKVMDFCSKYDLHPKALKLYLRGCSQ